MTETANSINTATTQFNNRLSISKVFDPRIITDDKQNVALWTSDSVELAKKGIADGYKLKESPFLKTVKDATLRKGNLPFNYTEDELDILKIVWNDKIFFGNNFIHLKDAEKGWQQITLRNYQEDLLHKYTNNKWNILMFPRQSGKTTTTVVEIVHFAISNYDKDMVVIAQSELVVDEILKKVKEAFHSLPFFMQPGFIKFNSKGFVLDNGCRLSIGVASESVVQGFSLDFLFIDEFAYIPAIRVNKFWNNIYPALVNNPHSKCIIASTPNGRNKFWELWYGAEMKKNKFVTSRIYWYDVPGRDEQFKQDTIANVGLEGWEMGFECSFDTQLRSIFPVKIQKALREKQRDYKDQWSLSNHYLGEVYGISFRNQNDYTDETGRIIKGIKYDLKKDYFLIGVDLAEGLEQDSSVLKIRKIEWDIENKCLTYNMIGVYKNNDISVEDFAEMNIEFFQNFDVNKLRVVVETNNYGGEYFAQVKNLRMNNPKFSSFDNIVFAKFLRNTKDDYEMGVRWDHANKKVGVKAFSNLVAKCQLDETHFESVEEYLNFGKNSNDTYSSQYGHDDLVMGDVSLAYFIKSNNLYATSFLKESEYNLRKQCDDIDEEIRKIEEAAKKQEESKIVVDGWTVRNHEEHWNNSKKGRNRGNTSLLI